MDTARAKARDAREEGYRVLGVRWGDPFPAGILLWTPGSAFTGHNPWKALKEISAPNSCHCSLKTQPAVPSPWLKDCP